MQPAADRADRDVEDFGNLFVVAPVDLAQDDDHTVVVLQSVERMADLLGPFASFDSVACSAVAVIDGLLPQGLAAAIERFLGAFLPRPGRSEAWELRSVVGAVLDRAVPSR